MGAQIDGIWHRGRGWLVAAIALVLLPGPATIVGAASLDTIDASDSRIVLRFDTPVDGASAFLLDGPRRLAVDVSGAVAGEGAAVGGVIAAVRHGQRDADTARVVFDLARSVVVTGGGFSDQGRTLTLEVADASADTFRRGARAGARLFRVADGRLAADTATTRAVLAPPLPAPGTRVPAVSGARGSNRPLIVIDAGHGGHDPGAPGPNGKREKEVTLAIAKAIRDELVASGRARVALTRSDDRFLVLGERREIARRLKADLFLSIHADSAPNENARGATVYTLSEVASDRVAAQLAARENRADILNGVDLGRGDSDVTSILFDLAQRETMNVSAGFAALLQREMSPKVSFRTDFHRFAGFIVLKAPDVPSVLLETGYMSNAEDAKRLSSKSFQRDVAIGVRRAVETHFARRLAAR